MQTSKLLVAIQQGSLPPGYAGIACSEIVNGLNACVFPCNHAASYGCHAAVVKHLVELFEHNQMPYALTGILAFGLYARHRARMTHQIEFIVSNNSMPLLETVLENAAVPFRYIQLKEHDALFIPVDWLGVETVIHICAADPGFATIIDSNVLTIFDQSLKVAKPEYLLWLFLISEELFHKVPAMNLLEQGQINTETVFSYLHWAQRPDLAEYLITQMRECRKVKRSYYELLAERRGSPSGKLPVYKKFGRQPDNNMPNKHDI